MSAPTAYTRETDRYDWVWVHRATRGEARASDLSERELDEAIDALTRRGQTDNAIATCLRTNIRLVNRRREMNHTLARAQPQPAPQRSRRGCRQCGRTSRR